MPNESDTSPTVKVEVQMPDGFEASRYQPKPGWDITLEDGVLTVEGGEIGPGQFDEFHFQARNPEEPTELTFPAIQTYDDGEVAEWVGAPDSDMPAPVVEIVAAEGDGHGGGDSEEAADETEAAVASGDTSGDTDRTGTQNSSVAGGVGPLVYTALVLGALGLLAGAGAWWKTQRVA